MLRTVRLPLIVVAVVALTWSAEARQPTAFTAEDMLDVAAIAVLDVSEDGRRIAATIRLPRDQESTDHRRYGDPVRISTARRPTGSERSPKDRSSSTPRASPSSSGTTSSAARGAGRLRAWTRAPVKCALSFPRAG